ncbi:MAG: SpoIIE family protein phosphatase [Bacteroidetes bacterium]|nr:SpoIIE family protein phosphatase [Bacteroidota bacterium]
MTLKTFFTTQIPDDEFIIQTLRKREMRIENLINRFRIIFFLLLIVFECVVNIVLKRLTTDALLDLSVYLFPIAGFTIIHFLTRKGTYRPWVKYYTVTSDLAGCCIYALFFLSVENFSYPIGKREFLLCMSFAILFFHTLSLYRGYYQIVLYSSILAIATNSVMFIYNEYFFMMGVFTTLMIINFSFFYFWAGRKIINNIISNLQLDTAYKEIKEANAEITQQNEEICTQRDEIEAKSKIIEIKNQETRQSIEYSLRIQKALLPEIDYINKFLPDSFIFYRPKDIVSGDFYWIKQISNEPNKFTSATDNLKLETENHKLLIAAADCTGHGVPGAFMSLIGAEKLNDAIDHTTHVGEILKLLNKGVKSALHQDASDSSTRDGMDIALCCYDTISKKLYYAGANRPLWLISNNSLIENKPTKTAIGGLTDQNQEFEVKVIPLKKDDTFYIFSDGFADQFGGPDGKKMMTKRFKDFLLQINSLPMNEQKTEIEKHFTAWKGNCEQVDDVLVIGVRV